MTPLSYFMIWLGLSFGSTVLNYTLGRTFGRSLDKAIDFAIAIFTLYVCRQIP